MSLINIAEAGPMSDAPRLSELVVNTLQFVLSFAGVIAVLIIVIAGIMYMTSAGNEDRVARAKLVLTGGIIGVIVILLSLVIVSAIARVV